MTTPISKVLVANRGEIALRIIRSIQEGGREAVAVYADQDLDAQFVKAADEAYALQGSSATQTYLDGDKILQIARQCGADAVHPGYGFLAESTDFARQVTDAGLRWIGPSPQVIELLGDKIRARRCALGVGVSPVPGTEEALTGRGQVEAFLAEWGFPVVLKAADGGGGRGIHVMQNDDDLNNFFHGRNLEGDGGAGFFVERYVPKARHLETQCGRDAAGNFTVFSTRDCSVQRRHQKLIEEAPAPFLSAETAEKLVANSQALFDAVDYVGLGTCEFLLPEEGDPYFLEVNPRLQVEHTVTEEVTGVDLVDTQIRIAEGASLPPTPPVRGHSIELRVTSEDPAADLKPTTGVLIRVAWPTGPGIRIDTGIAEGDAVSPEFDSMVAKIIVTAPTREQAISRALRVTEETVLEGVANPLPLYAHILSRSEFRGIDNGKLGVWTRWLESGVLTDFAAEYAEKTVSASPSTRPTDNEARAASQPESGDVGAPARRRAIIEIDGRRAELTFPADLFGGVAAPTRKTPQPLRSSRESARRAAGTRGPTDDNSVLAPSQAIVVRVAVNPGDEVAEGDLLLVLESMKMESYVCSPRAGAVESVLVETGANVSPGQILANLAPECAAPPTSRPRNGHPLRGGAPSHGSAT